MSHVRDLNVKKPSSYGILTLNLDCCCYPSIVGHNIVTNKLNDDDDDIAREVRNIFVRTNILFRRSHKCSFKVKVLLFKSYVVCMYDAALWKMYKVASLFKLHSCYHKCMEYFLGYNRFYSVSAMLLETGLSDRKLQSAPKCTV